MTNFKGSKKCDDCGGFFEREKMTFSPRGNFCPDCDWKRFYRSEPKIEVEEKIKRKKIVCCKCGKVLDKKAFGFFGDTGMKFFSRDGNYCEKCFDKYCPEEKKQLGV